MDLKVHLQTGKELGYDAQQLGANVDTAAHGYMAGGSNGEGVAFVP